MSLLQSIIGARDLRLRFGAAALACAALAGCTPAPPKPDAARVSQFSAHAYAPELRYEATTSLSDWSLGADSHEVAFTVPDTAGRFPLVIYLPGLGETRDAGNIWRTAWTRAGYAVLSIQPLAEDAKSWSSPKARTGDFAALARVRYSAQVMSQRIEVLQAVWRELAQRQARGDAPLGRIDLTRVAVAGFDLGAYTATTMAGESSKDLPQLAIAIPVRAVIALSPYADFSGTTFSERYRGIKGPVLSVTTDLDADSIGMVTSPSVRKAPFEYMPAGDKFLMLIWGVPHFVLSGNDAAGPAAPAAEAEKPVAGSSAQPPGSPGPGSRQRAKLPEPGKSDADRTAATVVSATDNAIGAAAIAGVTTAFLDAYLKNDDVAQEWLVKDAPRWLRDKGEFKKR